MLLWNADSVQEVISLDKQVGPNRQTRMLKKQCY